VTDAIAIAEAAEEATTTDANTDAKPQTDMFDNKDGK